MTKNVKFFPDYFFPQIKKLNFSDQIGYIFAFANKILYLAFKRRKKKATVILLTNFKVNCLMLDSSRS